MRNVICFALCLCLALLCGCGAVNAPEAPMVQHAQQTASPSAAAPSASADEPLTFVSGSVASPVYTNAFSGIRITLPAEWTYADASELEALSEYDAQGLLLSVTELIAQNDATGDNITVMYEATDAPVDAYAQAIAEELLLDEVFHFTAHEPETLLLCEKEYLNLRMGIEDVHREQLYLLRREGNMMIVIILTGQQPDDLLAMFS